MELSWKVNPVLPTLADKIRIDRYGVMPDFSCRAFAILNLTFGGAQPTGQQRRLAELSNFAG